MSAEDDSTTEDTTDTTETPAPEAEAESAESGTEEVDPRARDKISKANREAANLRKRVKELEPLAEKLRELEKSQQSEQERLSSERDSLKSRADTAETELLRLRVAMRKGLSEAQARRLVGSTEEELETDADDLLESFSPSSNQQQVPRRPVENLRGGSRPDTEPEETDPAKLASMVRRR